jgi:Erythromycin esterase
MEAVVAYLDEHDPQAAARARARYECLQPFAGDSSAYGQAVLLGVSEPCRRRVIEQLVELRRRAGEYLSRDGLAAEDEQFFAEQSAAVVTNAEEYYRTMFGDRAGSWNLRDRHMADTVDQLRREVAGRAPASDDLRSRRRAIKACPLPRGQARPRADHGPWRARRGAAIQAGGRQRVGPTSVVAAGARPPGYRRPMSIGRWRRASNDALSQPAQGTTVCSRRAPRRRAVSRLDAGGVGPGNGGAGTGSRDAVARVVWGVLGECDAREPARDR